MLDIDTQHNVFGLLRIPYNPCTERLTTRHKKTRSSCTAHRTRFFSLLPELLDLFQALTFSLRQHPPNQEERDNTKEGEDKIRQGAIKMDLIKITAIHHWKAIGNDAVEQPLCANRN